MALLLLESGAKSISNQVCGEDTLFFFMLLALCTGQEITALAGCSVEEDSFSLL